ncbi:MAG TPA: sigma 54-interacting transcriptional regulator [Anaeromyxobacteraceae bacterium]|nr:sigma 54-interacting transcriptional regulator [Anaeromyxobacteraceae bacterium]
MAVNCGGFTEGLLASGLFGYVRGVTGAVSEQQGLFCADLYGQLAQWNARLRCASTARTSRRSPAPC